MLSVYSLLSTHRTVGLLLSALVADGSTKFRSPKADTVSTIRHVFIYIYIYFYRETRLRFRVIDRDIAKLSTTLFVRVLFSFRVQRPFDINLHRIVDVELMTNASLYTQSVDQTFAPFTLITLNWQLGTVTVRASRPHDLSLVQRAPVILHQTDASHRSLYYVMLRYVCHEDASCNVSRTLM